MADTTWVRGDALSGGLRKLHPPAAKNEKPDLSAGLPKDGSRTRP
ncbi:protein of unassigned function [Methylobacterium oryzae CBMB20]|uniref:Protein of unassigned function n=1 Tax=Methylobacterium oryzae CBMB20 TaxID=693986 RepID=A0A089P244_9HYPH|nr:protein of unassigned function [Methylobacterium oryzae CBMB20]